MANITRLTMFALISALENDLRVIIQQIIDNSGNSPINDVVVVPENIFEKAKRRFEKCSNDFDECDISDIINYIDYQESMEIILRNICYLPLQHQEIFLNKPLVEDFKKSTQIRNRVMHSRPLEYSDLQDLNDLCEKIFKLDKKHRSFTELWAISSAIKNDPGVTLKYSIPECDIDENAIQNNLPLPDFDDTGYIGRSDLVDRIVSLCKGSFPVISILGDGGIGKTALALKVAYRLVDDSTHPFDAVIWSSSKTTQLNLFELHEIDGAIRTSLDLFNTISNTLVYETDNPINNIIEYLSLFKILLIIDNLETIIDSNITDFLQCLPKESKVLITSRIGLGRFEYPVFIEPMTMPDSVKLLRNYAKLRGIKILYQANAELLSTYCSKMNSNPGYIKWFVAGWNWKES
jgi:LuxR family glucitol operon transcriptional activator